MNLVGATKKSRWCHQGKAVGGTKRGVYSGSRGSVGDEEGGAVGAEAGVGVVQVVGGDDEVLVAGDGVVPSAGDIGVGPDGEAADADGGAAASVRAEEDAGAEVGRGGFGAEAVVREAEAAAGGDVVELAAGGVVDAEDARGFVAEDAVAVKRDAVGQQGVAIRGEGAVEGEVHVL